MRSLLQKISKLFWSKNSAKSIHAKTFKSKETKTEEFTIIPDYETQFPNSSEKRLSDIVIGFDFGTSTTKVIIRDPWGRRAYAIPFFNTENPDINSYLLPTKLAINNKCFYIPDINSQAQIKNLKLELINNPNKIIYSNPDLSVYLSSFTASSVYIACVLRYVRKWFFENCFNIYMNHKINWHLQIGIPSKNYDDESIKDIFEKCAMWGWWLSVQKGLIDINMINKVTIDIDNKSFDPGIHPDYINVFPEVAAEVAGYARSPLREDGLYLLIDIGARTLDVSTFNLLYNEGEHKYVFLLTSVEQLGAYELHRSRLNKISEILQGTPYFDKWKAEYLRLDDSTLPVPDNINVYCNYLNYYDKNKLLSELSSIENDSFKKKTHKAICWVISETKKRRYPTSPKWDKGLPVFVCGGGSVLSFYRNVIKECEADMKNIGCNSFKLLNLPLPEELQSTGLTSKNYHRLAVAYGLSFPFEDIGKIIPPSEVEDLVQIKRVRDVDKAYISKDMV